MIKERLLQKKTKKKNPENWFLMYVVNDASAKYTMSAPLNFVIEQKNFENCSYTR